MLEDFENSLTATSGLVTELRQAAGTDETARLATLFRSLVMTVSAYQGDLTAEIGSYCDNPRESDWQHLISMVGALAENVRRITKGLEREEGDFVFDAGGTYRDLALGMGSRKRVLAEIEAMRFPPSVNDITRLRAIAAKYRTLVADLHRSQDDLAQWIRDARENQERRPVDPKTARTDVVILVHGIRDFALWQNSVRSSLEKAGFTVEVTNYGRLNLIRFLMPFRWVRAYAIQAVAKQIRMVELRHPNKRISVIAHSFGTHVIASLLRDEFDTRFHRMIFCGSVVQYDFPFEQCVGRFEPELLNEVGTADIWPAVAESVTVGYGSAGTYGFRRPFVRDRWHNGAAHGFFLTPKFASEFWVPFLASGKVVPGSDPAKEPSAWLKLLSIFKIKYLILLALLAGLVAALVAIMPVRPSPFPPVPTPTPIIPTPGPDEAANEVLKDVDLGYSESALIGKLGPGTYGAGHSDVHNSDNYQLEEDLRRQGTYFQVVDDKKFADANGYFTSRYRQASWRIGDSILIARIDREGNKVSALRLETPLYREEAGTCLNVAKFGPLRHIVASGKKLCIGSATMSDFADPRAASIKSPYGPDAGWDATCAGEINPGGATGHGSYLSLSCQKSSYPNSPLAYDITLQHDGPEAVQDPYSSFGDEGETPTTTEAALMKFVQTYGKRVVNVIEFYSAE